MTSASVLQEDECSTRTWGSKKRTSLPSRINSYEKYQGRYTLRVSAYPNQDTARILIIRMRATSSPHVVSQCIISHLFPFHKREPFCAVPDIDVNLSAFMIKSISPRGKSSSLETAWLLDRKQTTG